MSNMAWFAENRWQLVLFHRSVILPSLVRVSTSPRPLYTLTTSPAGNLELVTMNPILGNSSPSCHSISSTTLSSYHLRIRLWFVSQLTNLVNYSSPGSTRRELTGFFG